MGVDWDMILNIKLEEINDDKAEVLYDQLIEFNPDNENNTDRLKRIFSVCKSVMQIKALQSDVALEELEEIVKNRYNKNEVENLRKELEIYKQNESAEGIGNKLHEINNENLELKSKIENQKKEIIKSKRKINEFENIIEVKDKEIVALKLEVNSLKEEIENQRQYDEKIVEKQEPIEKLREKNRHIQSLLDELKDMQMMNLELANQVKQLKVELNNATNEMNLSSNQMELVKDQMEELKKLDDELVKENNSLSKENESLKEEIIKKNQYVDLMNSNFEEKSHYFEKLLAQKDNEILELQSKNYLQSNNDNNKPVNKYIKEIQEKNNQIELLKTQLNKAVRDMEDQTEIIQKMLNESKENHEYSYLTEKIESLNKKLKRTDEEIQTKDEELLELKKRINLYEKQHYGLNDAMKEISVLQKQLQNRELRIEELIQQINQLNIQISETDYLSESDLENSHEKKIKMGKKKKIQYANKIPN